MEAPHLAANYSPQLVRLLDDEPGLVSAVKVSEFNEGGYRLAYADLRQRGVTLLLHGLGRDVNPGIPGYERRFRPEAVMDAVRATATPYLSLHLEWRTTEADCPGAAPFLADFTRQVAELRRMTDLPVLLENVYAYRSGTAPYRNPPFIDEPGFITEALDLAGDGFLLDLSHARVAAWHRGEDAREYLDSLPLERVVEIHASGQGMVEGRLLDRHLELSDEDYQMLRIALSRAKPETVTLEYGGVGPLFEDSSDERVLAEQLHILADIARGR